MVSACLLTGCEYDRNDGEENDTDKGSIDIDAYKGIFEKEVSQLIPVDFQPDNQDEIKKAKKSLLNVIPEWEKYKAMTFGDINFIEIPLNGDVYNMGTCVSQHSKEGSDDDFVMETKTLWNKTFLIIREDTKKDTLSYYMVNMAMENKDLTDVHFLGNKKIGDGFVIFSDLDGRCTTSYRVAAGKRYPITISSKILNENSREFTSISLNHIPNLSGRLTKSYSSDENGSGGFGTSSNGWAFCSFCRAYIWGNAECICEGYSVDGNRGGGSSGGGNPDSGNPDDWYPPGSNGGEPGGGNPGGDNNNNDNNDNDNNNNNESQATVFMLASANAVEAPDTYNINVDVLGGASRVAQVIYEMNRSTKDTKWVPVQNDSYTGGSTSTRFTYSRMAWTPGSWQIKATVYFQDGTRKESNIIQVEEQYPSIGKFGYNATLRSHLSGTLWTMAVDFARNNKATHAVREYGCLIYLSRNGTYYAGPTIEGPIAYLTSAGERGTVTYSYNDTPYDPREDAVDLVVGTLHTHYPLTWAATGQGRDIGASSDDNNGLLPGIGYDYARDVSSGHDVNATKDFFIYGPVRRATTR